MAVQTNKLSIRNLSKFDWKSVNQLENIMHWKNNILTTSLSFVSFKEISTDCVRNLSTNQIIGLAKAAVIERWPKRPEKPAENQLF